MEHEMLERNLHCASHCFATYQITSPWGKKLQPQVLSYLQRAPVFIMLKKSGRIDDQLSENVRSNPLKKNQPAHTRPKHRYTASIVHSRPPCLVQDQALIPSTTQERTNDHLV